MFKTAIKTTFGLSTIGFTYWQLFVRAQPHKADYDSPATIACKCGQVKITFRGNARLSLECACSDCSLRMEWA